MTGFSIFRVLLLGLVWALSIVVLGMAANSVALSVGTVWLFPNLALGVSITTHAIATPMLVISFARKAALTSQVIVELSWVGVLWMLWLAVAVVTSSTPIFTPSCTEYQDYFGDEVASECTQFIALQATAWLITALLLLYSVTLFTLAILTNLWNRDKASSGIEKKPHTNAFFSDAANLRFFCAPLRSKHWTKKVDRPYVKTPMAMTMPERRDSKFAPQFESNHQFWNEISLSADEPGSRPSSVRKGEGRESRLERGYSTSTAGSNQGSIAKSYVPSPLSSSVGLGQPKRAVLPSQSPYMTTKKATATSMAFVALGDGKQF